MVAAPTFAFAAAYAAAWDPAPERLPTVLGLAALTAAVTAAVARALDRQAEEALRVWMVTGVACFVVTAGGALAGASPQVVWTILLVLAMLAARFVPGLAVDVPDQFLIDIERLAVTAWSARDRPVGRRGRIVVPRPAVAAVAERGTHTIVAASAAIAAVAACVGAAPAGHRRACRSTGSVRAAWSVSSARRCCWRPAAIATPPRADCSASPAWSAGSRSPSYSSGSLDNTGLGFVIGGAIGLAALLVVVAVAVGRGWRSAWWSRRAEVAEGISGAFALGAVVVAVGLFRRLWELTGQGLTP